MNSKQAEVVGGNGRSDSAAPAVIAVPSKSRAGRTKRAKKNGQTADARARQLKGGGGNGLGKSATRVASATPPPPDLPTTLAEIRAWHRWRVFAMDLRKVHDLKLGSQLRTQLGWSRKLPRAEAQAINDAAAELIATGEKVLKLRAGGRVRSEPNVTDEIYQKLAGFIEGSLASRSYLVEMQEQAEAALEQLCEALPVVGWWREHVFSGSLVSLAVIIGETGHLSLYSNPAKVWKRMGVAVLDGVRQGGLRKTASKEDWIKHGYSAERRSRMWVIGDVLVKHPGYYREVYLERKAYLRQRAVSRGLIIAPAAKIPKARKDEFISDGHIHKDAQRYMEKRLLKNLWQAWRDGGQPARSVLPTYEAVPVLPAAQPSAQAERSATRRLQPIVSVPSAELGGIT